MEGAVELAVERNGTDSTKPAAAELRVWVEIHPEIVMARNKTQRFPDGLRVLMTVEVARALAAKITELVGD